MPGTCPGFRGPVDQADEVLTQPVDVAAWIEAGEVRVPSLKVTVPLAASALPGDLVPMDGPAGEPVLDLVLEGGSLTVRAKVNGKNYRKLLKQVQEHGAKNMAVALQGVLRPPSSPGGPFELEGAGFQAVVKTPKPADPE